MALLNPYSNEREQVCSVGIGGDYPDLDSAMIVIEQFTGWDEMPVTGTVSIAKNKDLMSISGGNFSAAQSGDFIEITNAHKNTSTYGSPTGNATKPFLELTSGAATEARLVAGVTNTVTDSIWRLFRPRHVIVRLLNQTHLLLPASVGIDIPHGLTLSLIGDDGAKVIGGGNGAYYLRNKRCSSIFIYNIEFDHVHEFVFPSRESTGGFDGGQIDWNNGYAPDGIMHIQDISVRGDSSFYDPNGSRVYICNVKGTGILRSPSGDDLVMSDCFIKASYNNSSFTAAHYRGQITKKSKIINCHFENSTGECLSIGLDGSVGYKEYDVINTYIGASIDRKAVSLGYSKYLLANCVIDGLIDLNHSSSVVNFVNTRRSDGAFPSLIKAANAIITVDGVPYQA